MTKIDIISGFLGAGKTTLIKKLLAEAYAGEKLVLIENEFGEISIDGGFLKESGVQISEMSSGCICCSLVGDFGEAMKDVYAQFKPDRIIIEPSGVGKLSDVISAVEKVTDENGDMTLNSFITVADATKCKVYMKNFGEFFNNQVENAGCIILSRTGKISAEKLDTAVSLLREKNPSATIITTPWEEISGKQILDAMEKTSHSFAEELMKEVHHHHGEECDDPHCSCHHDHEHEHEHAHHHEQDHCCDHAHHEHEHHHEHHDHEHHHEHSECSDPHCCCHDHDHGHHHHHHADEVFTSWGAESPKVFSDDEIRRILTALDSGEYGMVVRSKGIVPAEGNRWIHFDYVPEEHEIRDGSADVTGRICVIGSQLKESALKALFGI